MADRNTELMDELREEFNAQPIEERFRTGGFMTYEAVMELRRERDHALATIARIDTRIDRLLQSERYRRISREARASAPVGPEWGDEEEGEQA